MTATVNDYLHAMQITPWVSRQSAGPTTSTLATSAAATVRVVVQWSRDELRLAPDHPAGALLGNILEALKLSVDDYQIEQIRAADEFNADANLDDGQATHLLAFVQGASSSGAIFGLPTLEQMLADRQQKKAAWDQLKPWVGKLTG